MLPFKERQEIIAAHWGFTCNCWRCTFDESLAETLSAEALLLETKITDILANISDLSLLPHQTTSDLDNAVKQLERAYTSIYPGPILVPIIAQALLVLARSDAMNHAYQGASERGIRLLVSLGFSRDSWLSSSTICSMEDVIMVDTIAEALAYILLASEFRSDGIMKDRATKMGETVSRVLFGKAEHFESVLTHIRYITR
jgi:hypothetical protein